MDDDEDIRFSSSSVSDAEMDEQLKQDNSVVFSVSGDESDGNLSNGSLKLDDMIKQLDKSMQQTPQTNGASSDSHENDIGVSALNTLEELATAEFGIEDDEEILNLIVGIKGKAEMSPNITESSCVSFKDKNIEDKSNAQSKLVARVVFPSNIDAETEDLSHGPGGAINIERTTKQREESIHDSHDVINLDWPENIFSNPPSDSDLDLEAQSAMSLREWLLHERDVAGSNSISRRSSNALSHMQTSLSAGASRFHRAENVSLQRYTSSSTDNDKYVLEMYERELFQKQKTRRERDLILAERDAQELNECTFTPKSIAAPYPSEFIAKNSFAERVKIMEARRQVRLDRLRRRRRAILEEHNKKVMEPLNPKLVSTRLSGRADQVYARNMEWLERVQQKRIYKHIDIEMTILNQCPFRPLDVHPFNAYSPRRHQDIQQHTPPISMRCPLTWSTARHQDFSEWKRSTPPLKRIMQYSLLESDLQLILDGKDVMPKDQMSNSVSSKKGRHDEAVSRMSDDNSMRMRWNTRFSTIESMIQQLAPYVPDEAESILASVHQLLKEDARNDAITA